MWPERLLKLTQCLMFVYIVMYVLFHICVGLDFYGFDLRKGLHRYEKSFEVRACL